MGPEGLRSNDRQTGTKDQTSLKSACCLAKEFSMKATYEGWRHAPWALLLAISGLTIVLDDAYAPLWAALCPRRDCPALAQSLESCRRDRSPRGPGLGGSGHSERLAGSGIGVDGNWGVWPSRAGRLTYLMVLLILAGLVSVLGARSPGGGAWAILMALLVVVFLIPWLEAGGRIRHGQGMAQLQLRSPWTLFYGLLVVAGVTNYLPTRYGPVACAIGNGVGSGVSRPDPWRLERPGTKPDLAGRGLDAGSGGTVCGLLCWKTHCRAERSGTALALVSRSLGGRLGPAGPGTVQSSGRARPDGLRG